MDKKEQGRQRYMNVLRALQKIFNKQEEMKKRIEELEYELSETQRILTEHITKN